MTSSADTRRDTTGNRAGAPWVVPTVVGLATLLARWLEAASGPTDWDSVQYAVGSRHYDVTHGAPQPPGYWLYVTGGRLLHDATGIGLVHSLVLLAAVASALAAAFTYLAGADLGGPWVGLGAAALVATAPVVWFNGSIVSTYSFDALVAAVLVVLAWRARPGGWQGLAAVAVVGIGAGFRFSMVEMFVPLALIAVVRCTRSWDRLGLTALVAVLALGVWFVPMLLSQPGGLSAWLRATHAETVGALRTSSVFDTPAGAAVNTGTFGAFSLLTVGAAALIGAVAAAAAVVVAALAWATRHGVDGPGVDGPGLDGHRVDGPGLDGHRLDGPGVDGHRVDGPAADRPWYQGRATILAAAVVPPVAVVTLMEFATGGYALAYVPSVTIFFLLPVGALLGHRSRTVRRATGVAFAVAVLLAGAVNVERFTRAPAILPASVMVDHPGWWISQARYSAPYPETAATIAAADRADADFGRLAAMADPRRDVIVAVASSGGENYYRNLGWAVPGVTAALVFPPTVLYNERDGLLYYTSVSTVAVGAGGHALVLVQSRTAELVALAARGLAVDTGRRVAGLEVWRVEPGATLFGVTVRAVPGRRPLGHGT